MDERDIADSILRKLVSASVCAGAFTCLHVKQMDECVLCDSEEIACT